MKYIQWVNIGTASGKLSPLNTKGFHTLSLLDSGVYYTILALNFSSMFSLEYFFTIENKWCIHTEMQILLILKLNTVYGGLYSARCEKKVVYSFIQNCIRNVCRHLFNTYLQFFVSFVWRNAVLLGSQHTCTVRVTHTKRRICVRIRSQDLMSPATR